MKNEVNKTIKKYNFLGFLWKGTNLLKLITLKWKLEKFRFKEYYDLNLGQLTSLTQSHSIYHFKLWSFILYYVDSQ